MIRKPVQFLVNGQSVAADVEPRMQLADFLREQLLLTGTHLGCEHGVCGACTVNLNGAPARSCITYAITCGGADVRTIEGFDDDAVMAELREAFTAEHALQCGYCTPGMLVTARDIVTRIPDADESRIRKELAGNLCRCTGYVGIVRAIQRVLSAHGGTPQAGRRPVTRAQTSAPPAQEPLSAENRQPVGARAAKPAEQTKPQTTLHQSFTVDHPRDKVWDFFGRLDEVTLCLPGASVIGTPSDSHVDMKLRVKLGPIAPEFQGGADVVRDAAAYSGTIIGSARDMRSSSATRGDIRYVLLEEKNGVATRVEIDVAYTLTGALAQFSRSSIVQDIAKRMTHAFAANLEARLNQSQAPVREIDAGSLFFSAVWARARAFVRSLFGR